MRDIQESSALAAAPEYFYLAFVLSMVGLVEAGEAQARGCLAEQAELRRRRQGAAPAEPQWISRRRATPILDMQNKALYAIKNALKPNKTQYTCKKILKLAVAERRALWKGHSMPETSQTQHPLAPCHLHSI